MARQWDRVTFLSQQILAVLDWWWIRRHISHDGVGLVEVGRALSGRFQQRGEVAATRLLLHRVEYGSTTVRPLQATTDVERVVGNRVHEGVYFVGGQDATAHYKTEAGEVVVRDAVRTKRDV